MKLYVIKCDGGYVKKSVLPKYECVPIEKASVFNERNLREAEALVKYARNDKINNVRIVELIITEREIKS